MIPVLLSPAELGAVQSMLGAELEAWQDAVQMAFEHSIRGGTYDPARDGPLLRDHVIWVGPQHLDLVEFALSGLVNAADALELRAMSERLAPLRRALSRAGASWVDPADLGTAAG